MKKFLVFLLTAIGAFAASSPDIGLRPSSSYVGSNILLSTNSQDFFENAGAPYVQYQYGTRPSAGQAYTGNPVVQRDSVLIDPLNTNVWYDCWPGVVRLANGDLYAAWSRGLAHVGLTNHVIVASRSTNMGATWSTPVTIFSPESGGLTNTIGNVQLSRIPQTGKIWISTYENDPYNPTSSAFASNVFTSSFLWVASATEDASGTLTWGSKVTVQARTNYSNCWFTADRVQRLDDGSYVMSVYGTGGKLGIYKSTDDGATWSLWKDLGAEKDFSEPRLLNLGSSNLMMVIRNSSGVSPPSALAQGYYIRRSSDNGASWDASVQSIALSSGPGRPGVELLGNGAIVLVGRGNPGAIDGANWIYTSWDNGTNWTSPTRLVGSTLGPLYDIPAGTYSVGQSEYAEGVPLSATEVGFVFSADTAATDRSLVAYKSIAFGNGTFGGGANGPGLFAKGAVIQSASYLGTTHVQPFGIQDHNTNFVVGFGHESTSTSNSKGELTLWYNGSNPQYMQNNNGQFVFKGATGPLIAQFQGNSGQGTPLINIYGVSTGNGMLANNTSGKGVGLGVNNGSAYIPTVVATAINTGFNLSAGTATWPTPNTNAVVHIGNQTIAGTYAANILLTGMTKAQRDAMASPVSGSIVHVTDGTDRLCIYVGGAWYTLNVTADP